MDIVVNRAGDRVDILINFESGRGNIDERRAEELKRHFRDLDPSTINEVVFDFRNVNHIGSAGIGKLLLFYKDMALNGGKIRIENASETVYELFNVLKLDTIFVVSR
jgi:anti-anti-sigma factor